jgi:hypothetical protein
VPTRGTLERIATLEPELQPLALELVRLAGAAGHRITVTSGRRSTTEQAAIHASNPAGSAPPGRSKHEQGRAFDVAFLNADGTWSYDGHWLTIGELGESLGLRWGGRWRRGQWKGTLGDRPHFELP